MTLEQIGTVLEKHREWVLDNSKGENANLSDADLRGADLSGADLSGADLSRITLCGANIDGAVLSQGSVKGPGHILCALTDAEWEQIKKGRAGK